jgi:hypothetical protein
MNMSGPDVYNKFVDEMRTSLLKERPELTPLQLLKEVGRLWEIHAQLLGLSPPEPVVQPLYYSATNYPYTAEEFIAAKTEELLNHRLGNTLSRIESDPPISTAKTYDKYADDIRIWVVQRYPEWSVDQVIAELKRLWTIQEEKIKSVMTEVAPPGPIMRIPPPKDRRMTAPHDPFSAFATAMADATTRGARANAARLAVPPPIPPVLLTMEEVKPEGREVDWAKIIRGAPKVLPPNKDERDILKAIMGVWQG